MQDTRVVPVVHRDGKVNILRDRVIDCRKIKIAAHQIGYDGSFGEVVIQSNRGSDFCRNFRDDLLCLVRHEYEEAVYDHDEYRADKKEHKKSNAGLLLLRLLLLGGRSLGRIRRSCGPALMLLMSGMFGCLSDRRICRSYGRPAFIWKIHFSHISHILSLRSN